MPNPIGPLLSAGAGAFDPVWAGLSWQDDDSTSPLYPVSAARMWAMSEQLRGVTAQLGSVFSARAYGAVGNGSTDDTAAIQAAVDAAAAAGGGIAYLPQTAGSAGYRVKSATNGGIQIPANVELRGSGRAGRLVVTARADIPASTRLIQNKNFGTTGDANVTVRDVYIQGPGDPVADDDQATAIRLGADVDGALLPVGHGDNLKVIGCTIADWPGPQIFLNNATNFKAIGNTLLRGKRGGIVVWHDSYIGVIALNTTQDNGDDSIALNSKATYPHRISIVGNTIQHLDHPPAAGNCGIVSRGGKHVTISGNTIEGTGAVGQTRAGVSIVDGDNQIPSQDVTVSGNTILDASIVGIAVGGDYPSGINNINVIGNTVRASTKAGILVRPGDPADVMDTITIENNTLKDCGSTESFHGIEIGDSTVAAGAVIRGLVVGRNKIHSPGGSGIKVFSTVKLVAGEIGGYIRNPHRVGATANSDPFAGDNSIDAVSIAGVVDDLDMPGVRVVVDPSTETTGTNTLTTTPSTLNVTLTDRFAASGKLMVAKNVVTYTGKTSSPATFTGCTIASGSVTVDPGAAVSQSYVRRGIGFGGTLSNVRVRNQRIRDGHFRLGAIEAPSGTNVAVEQPNKGVVVALVDRTNVGVDATAGDYFTLDATGATRNIGAPDGIQKGWRLTFELLTDRSAGTAFTWNAVYKTAGWADPAYTKRKTITFVCYDGTNLMQVGPPSADL